MVMRRMSVRTGIAVSLVATVIRMEVVEVF